MSRMSLAIIVAAVVAAFSATQARTAAQTPSQAGGNSISLGTGTTLNAELNSGIDSRKAKAGDTVAAHITADIKADGKTVLPNGTKLLGHLTQVSARVKGDVESSLAIQFDKAVLKNGQEVSLSVWIKAIAAEPRGPSSSGPELNGMAGSSSPSQTGSPMGASHSQLGGVPSAAPTAGEPSHSSERLPDSEGGLNAAGQLSPNSRGVFGLDGVRLADQGSLIISTGKSVHLDSGTRLLLVSQAEASATTDK